MAIAPDAFGWVKNEADGTYGLYFAGTRIMQVTSTGVVVTGTLAPSGAATISGLLTASAGLRGGTGPFGLGAPATATIATGVLTVTKPYVIMDAEGAGTTDQLDSITVSGWTATDGDLLLLVANATDTITVDDANINLGAATRAVAPGGSLLLRYDGGEAQWTELAFLTAADNV